MALTEQGKLLTEVQRQQQLGLRALTMQDVITLWPIWDPTDSKSYERFVTAAVALVQARSRDAGLLAQRYYAQFHLAETSKALGRLEVAMPAVNEEALRASLSATAQAGYYRALGASYPAAQASQQALVQTAGAIGRHVLNGGRSTIIDMSKHDSRAWGWARITDGKPCAFCAMVASRGPVYKDDTVQFHAHDHCGCTCQPVYSMDDWPGDARKYEELWQQARAEKGTDPTVAFRRLVEGRQAPAPGDGRIAKPKTAVARAQARVGTNTPAMRDFEAARINSRIRLIQERAAGGAARTGDAETLAGLQKDLSALR